MLTVEDGNRVMNAATNGLGPAEVGLPDTQEVRDAIAADVADIAALPPGAEITPIQEWPDAASTDSLYSKTAAQLADEVYGPPSGPTSTPPPATPPPAPTGGKGFEASEEKAAGGLDQNRGNAETLRHYWVDGPGAAKINWGVAGDYNRCVAELTPHLGIRAHGYCQLRHHDATGAYAGHAPGEGGGKGFLDGRGLLEFKADPNAVDPLTNPPADAPTPDAGVGNPNPDGVMVALYLPHDVAQAIAIPGGTPPTELHVTLAYLGKAADLGDPQALIDAVKTFADDSFDLTGEISGIGRFAGNDADGDPIYASVEVPELPDWRIDLVDALTQAGFDTANDHGFTPHVTLAYVPADAPTPIERMTTLPVTFDMLSVSVGPDVHDFPLHPGDGSLLHPDAAQPPVDTAPATTGPTAPEPPATPGTKVADTVAGFKDLLG